MGTAGPRGALIFVPAAIAAGLGELGKHGSIINLQHRSSFRLAAVATELPCCSFPMHFRSLVPMISARIVAATHGCGICIAVCPSTGPKSWRGHAAGC
jgi:epoxyqueuosine reductase QueG